MIDIKLHEIKLVRKHLTEWAAIFTSDLQAWQQLKINHKQALKEVGFVNFTAWNQQKEEAHKLGEVLAFARLTLKNRQQTELEAMLVLVREA